MRRCLHALLVGVLVFSTSADVARGCWHLRRCRPNAWQPAPACPPVGWAGDFVVPAETWSAADADEACGCDGAPVDLVETVVGDVLGSETIVAEAAAEPTEPVPAPAAANAADVPTIPEIASRPTPESAAVQQASAAEPDIGFAAVPEQRPAAEVVAAAPAVVEENLFTLADAATAAARAADVDGQPASDRPPTADDGLPEEPAEEADEPRPEPANPLDAAMQRTGEPARMWIDVTGRHSVVGVMVDRGADGTCRLDTGAGLVEIPLEALCRRDREYAEQAAARLAAGRSDLSETVAR